MWLEGCDWATLGLDRGCVRRVPMLDSAPLCPSPLLAPCFSQGYADVAEAPADTLLALRAQELDKLYGAGGPTGGTSVAAPSSGLIPRTFDMLFEVCVYVWCVYVVPEYGCVLEPGRCFV
jgi:hypothetical protein